MDLSRAVLILIFPALLVAAAQATPQGPLAVDPLFFTQDECLAPMFEGAGCPAPAAGDERPTASAALLPWEMGDGAPMAEPDAILVLDRSVLREGADVTYAGGRA